MSPPNAKDRNTTNAQNSKYFVLVEMYSLNLKIAQVIKGEHFVFCVTEQPDSVLSIHVPCIFYYSYCDQQMHDYLIEVYITTVSLCRLHS